MRTLTAHHDGIEIAYQRFGTIGDPLLLIMGIGADMRYWHDDFCNALVRRISGGAVRQQRCIHPPRLGGHAGSSPGAPAS